jgi:hypothetical protein
MRCSGYRCLPGAAPPSRQGFCPVRNLQPVLMKREVWKSYGRPARSPSPVPDGDCSDAQGVRDGVDAQGPHVYRRPCARPRVSRAGRHRPAAPADGESDPDAGAFWAPATRGSRRSAQRSPACRADLIQREIHRSPPHTRSSLAECLTGRVTLRGTAGRCCQ